MDGGDRTLALGSRSGSRAAFILWPALCTRHRARARDRPPLGRNRRSRLLSGRLGLSPRGRLGDSGFFARGLGFAFGLLSCRHFTASQM